MYKHVAGPVLKFASAGEHVVHHVGGYLLLVLDQLALAKPSGRGYCICLATVRNLPTRRLRAGTASPRPVTLLTQAAPCRSRTTARPPSYHRSCYCIQPPRLTAQMNSFSISGSK